MIRILLQLVVPYLLMNSIMDNFKTEKRIWKKLSIILLWILIWQLLAIIVGKEVLFASPINVIKCLLELLRDPLFIKDIFNSLYHILLGFTVSLILALILSFISIRIPIVYSFLSPFFTFIKSTPVAAFILMAFLVFGSQGLSSFICFLMALPILYTNLTDGLLSVPKPMMDAARVYNMPDNSKWRYIYLPHSVPFFLSGCSVSLGLAWKSGIAAEVIGITRHSLGEHLYDAKLYLDTPQVFAVTIVIVFLSWTCEKLIMYALKAICKKFI